MRLQHQKTIQPIGKLKEGGRFPRITSICWSPNNYKFAISNSDRNIIIYDAEGNECDKFATKSANKEETIKKYQIRSIVFSPDSTKLAIAQTDCIVYVYRLGEDAKKFGEKKSICNKFIVSSAVTSMCWPLTRDDELVFGTASGKLKIGILKINGVRKNKSATLFETNSFVNDIVSSNDGNYFYSLHANKCIYLYTFPDPKNNISAKKVLFCQLSFVPNTIQIGYNANDVIVTSTNGNIQILNSKNGEIRQHLELNPSGIIQCAAMNPSGQNVVFGSFDCFYVCSYHKKSKEWQMGQKYVIDKIGTLTSIKWKFDGSKLSIASMCGSVDFYEACLKKYKFSDRFLIVYTALNSVVVHNRFSDEKLSILSDLASEITKIQIFENRFVVAKTEKSLIFGDMNAVFPLTEIEWNGQNEKYNFDTEGIALIFYSSELFVVEFGKNEVLGSCRTEFDSPHLVSLRLNSTDDKKQKIISYLLDLQSICILDLDKNEEIETIVHDLPIAWIELNEFGNSLLFMDKNRSLHLFCSSNKKRIKLLNFCNYAQWVPDSNVVVAQNRRNLCVWYNIHNTSQVTIVDIKSGEVEDIRRSDDKTIVLVNECNANGNVCEYTLNESLITFGTALDDQKYESAVTKLSRLCEKNQGKAQCSEISSMWKQLSQIALKNEDFAIAQRCFIALGDISKASYLNKMSNAKMAILNKQFKKAEALYMSAGEIDKAIIIYIKLNKWEEAIKLCKLRKHPLLKSIKHKFYQYLIGSQQFIKAAQIKQNDGDYVAALNLFLSNGFALNALQLIIKHSIPVSNEIIDELYHIFTEKQSDFESAGLLFEHLNDLQRAFDVYLRGNIFYKNLKMAKKHNLQFGDRVTEIEELWASHLYQKGECEEALPHFIESANYQKATECAIKCKQFNKAIQILSAASNNSNLEKYYLQIAKHFESMKKYQIATKLLIKGKYFRDAIIINLKIGNFEQSNVLIERYLPNVSIFDLYFEEAQRLESQNKIEEAMALLIKAKDINSAISLCKKHGINLKKLSKFVEANDDFVCIANELQKEGKFAEAQSFFVRAKDIKSAVAMYETNGMMQEAIKCCKQFGTKSDFEAMMYEYALSLNDDDKAIEALLEHNFFGKAIDYLCERSQFVQALKIANSNNCNNQILDSIHYQFALQHEENGNFEAAEREFLEAKRAKESIEMYIHQKMWTEAVRVSKHYEPELIDQVYRAHGIVSAENMQFDEAEKWFIAGNAVEDAIKMYKNQNMFDDALRLAQLHNIECAEIANLSRQQQQIPNDNGNDNESMQSIKNTANLLLKNGNYEKAVDVLVNCQYCELWENACNISMEKALICMPQTLRLAANKFEQIGKFEESANYFLEIGDVKAAISSFLNGGFVEKAKQICKIYENEQMLKQIEQKYDDEKKQIAQESILCQSQSLFESGKIFESMHILQSKLDKIERSESALTFYLQLMQSLICAMNECDFFADFERAKNEICQIVNFLHFVCSSDDDVRFEDYLIFFHLLQVKSECFERIPSLFQQQCLCLLSFSDWIRCDVLFKECGDSCKQLNDEQNAFIFYNHFVDICDFMDAPNDADIDYSDFMSLSNDNCNFKMSIPHKIIPSTHIFSEKEREQIRDWVLEMLATAEINPLLSCFSDRSGQPMPINDNNLKNQRCIVTGFVLLTGDKIVKCRECSKCAIKSAWNLYVDEFKICPWCKQMQAPIY